MSMTVTHERPGVYSSYEASSLTAAANRGGVVAVVARLDREDAEPYYAWSSYSRAVGDVGAGVLSEMARLAIRNGAGLVYGIPVKTVEEAPDYDSALAVAAGLEDVTIVVCDSDDKDVQKKLMDSVQTCSAARKERIAVVGGKTGEDVDALIERAKGLNCERVALVASGAVDDTGAAIGGYACAAAAAGAIAGNADPALPLGGVQLYGLSGLETNYDDGEIDRLIKGGVTPLETLAGNCYVVRAVTTRTTNGAAEDATWRELTTILVVDEVIPGIRDSLRAKFARAKNTEQTRGAIRSQTVMELEKRVSREIIDSYEDVAVSALPEDPAVCLVEFAFTVAHGLNQIWLSAHITV